MQYDLVFEGGGAKGMVFVGAMDAFEAAGHTYGRLLGTSAGAITASLLAAGYTSRRMLDALGEEEQGQPVFAGFMGVPGPFGQDEIENSATAEFLAKIDVPFVPNRWEANVGQTIIEGLLKLETYRHVFSFVENGGWFSASRFLDWMTEKLEAAEDGGRTGYGSMTLSQFFAATGNELCLIASDTSARRILVMNHRTAPDCPLVWAVRMSMSLPLVWPEVEWESGWGRYRGEDVTGHLVVDGGMLSNFPIELLVSDQPHVTRVMGERRSGHVLGFLIDETRAVPGAPPLETGDAGIQWGKLRTARRLMALIDTMTSAHDKEVIEVFEHMVARLPAQGFGTTEFAMSPARRDALVAAGRDVTEDFLAKAAAPRRRARRAPFSDAERQAMAADRIATDILGL